jgi:hypothetical protein
VPSSMEISLVMFRFRVVADLYISLAGSGTLAAHRIVSCGVEM